MVQKYDEQSGADEVRCAATTVPVSETELVQAAAKLLYADSKRKAGDRRYTSSADATPGMYAAIDVLKSLGVVFETDGDFEPPWRGAAWPWEIEDAKTSDGREEAVLVEGAEDHRR
jgi:hypothetical protein